MVEVDVIRGKGVCVDNPGASGKDLFSLVIQWTDGREISGFFLQGRYRNLVCEGGRMGGKKEGGWEEKRREDGREEGGRMGGKKEEDGREEGGRMGGKKGGRMGGKKEGGWEGRRREDGREEGRDGIKERRRERERREEERERREDGRSRERDYRLWYSLIRCRVYPPQVQCSLHGPQSPDTSQQGSGGHCL